MIALLAKQDTRMRRMPCIESLGDAGALSNLCSLRGLSTIRVAVSCMRNFSAHFRAVVHYIRERSRGDDLVNLRCSAAARLSGGPSRSVSDGLGVAYASGSDKSRRVAKKTSGSEQVPGGAGPGNRFRKIWRRRKDLYFNRQKIRLCRPGNQTAANIFFGGCSYMKTDGSSNK